MYFCSRPIKIVTFLRKNGDLPEWVVDFLLEKVTFAKIWPENFDNNIDKPLKSSWILRVQPKTLEIFGDFVFFMFFFLRKCFFKFLVFPFLLFLLGFFHVFPVFLFPLFLFVIFFIFCFF